MKVVQKGNFVGVVAQTEWAAIRAARALKVTWSAPPTQFPAGPEAMYDYLQNTKPLAERVGDQHRQRGGGIRTGVEDIRRDVSMAVPDARDDWTVVRGCRRAGEQGHRLVWLSGAVHHA